MEFAANGFKTVAIDFTYQGSLKLFFALLPDQDLVRLDDGGSDEIVVSGVELFDGYELSRKAAFRELLADKAESPFPQDKIVVADVASGDMELKQLLLAHCDIHVCAITPSPVAVASLAKTDQDTPLTELRNTVLVLNMLDDTRTLSRHSHVFVRSTFEHLLGGTVRYDENVAVATASFEHLASMFPNCAVLSDIRKFSDILVQKCGLADRLASEPE